MQRKIEIDMLKGFLIMLVVIGHTSLFQGTYNDAIFWFHMPAFFMVSGYLTHTWNNEKPVLRKRILRLIVPYFSYSLLLYLLYRPDPLWKNVARVVLAGNLNITIYSFPFWFVNSLFVALCGYSYVLTKVKGGGKKSLIILIIYIVIHVPHIIGLKRFPLPWGIDNALGALVFIHIGNRFKNYAYKKWHKVFMLIPIAFIIANVMFGLNYKLNMSGMVYNDFFLDLIVPCSFTYFFWQLFVWLKSVMVVAKPLAFLGQRSMTIMFVHAAVLYSVRHLFNDIESSLAMSVAIVTAIIVGCVVHDIFNKYKYSRLLFIGQK